MSDAVNPISNARLLGELRELGARAGGVDTLPGGKPGEFAALVTHYLGRVNEAQQQARGLAADFEAGARDVQLVDVMVSMQRSRIAFEALTQVRNRFLSAYQEIMNMPV